MWQDRGPARSDEQINYCSTIRQERSHNNFRTPDNRQTSAKHQACWHLL